MHFSGDFSERFACWKTIAYGITKLGKKYIKPAASCLGYCSIRLKEIGQDARTAVGDYTAPYPLLGKIENVRVQTE